MVRESRFKSANGIYMQNILVIEDEVDIAELICFNLRRHHYKALVAHDGVTGLEMARYHHPDLVVLDLMLPRMDGMSVFKDMRNRQETSDIPVLMLTAKAQLQDRIAGLEMGAEDYLVKPFSPKELMLRIKTILRRVSASADMDSNFVCGPFTFQKDSLRFSANGEHIDLTSTEFKLMLFLCAREGVAQERHVLLKEVWGYHDDVNSRTLDTHMKRLRQKLGQYSAHLETVRGVGYRIINEPLGV